MAGNSLGRAEISPAISKRLSAGDFSAVEDEIVLFES
jgi:hypothetical protein